MITLFHVDHAHDPKAARDLRFPFTDEMEAISSQLHGVDWSKATPEQRALMQRHGELASAELSRLAAAMFEAGGYVRVARIEGDENYAYEATQNGVLSDSWSREPPPGVSPCEPSFHLHEGRRLGRKSTDIGDLLLVNGRMLVVDSIGFKPVAVSEAALARHAASTPPGQET